MTQPGQVIGGRYRLAEELGAGGFGRVWKAHDQTLRTDVAVKELWLPPAMAAAERSERLQRARREALNAVKLRDHPHIVSVYDVVIEDDVPWIVMQLVVGRSLQEHLGRHGPLPPDTAAKIAAALLKALGAMHTAGIVHRDLKPANVMLADGGDVLLTDFGIAVSRTDPRLTASGAVIGSVGYLAPERARGENGRAASDLFSLGATLYEAVEGVGPFSRDTPAGSFHAVVYEEAAPPRRAGRLAPLINGLLAKDPDERLTVAAALALLDSPSAATGSGSGADAPTKPAEAATAPRQPQVPRTRKLPEAPNAPKPRKRPETPKPRATPQGSKPRPAPQPPRPWATPQPPRPRTTPQPPRPWKAASGGGPAAAHRTPPPKRATPRPAAAAQGAKASQSDSSGGTLGVLAVIALILGIVYADNQGFADWVSSVAHGDIANAQTGDCVHDIPAHDKDPGGWVTVPCWSAATRYTVLVRLGPASSRLATGCQLISSSWKVTYGHQQVTFLDDDNQSATLCVVPKHDD
ncbi:protein kinase [Streptomyces lydicus]|uniref:serine/threonine-protein kinase n=1 Tax=Streptomyces lydicus TaxID=47763 RepID=UPI003788F042